MFKILLDLDTEFFLSGLNALDWRRSRGLPDGTIVRLIDKRDVSAVVDEAFARAHFEPDWVAKRKTVPTAALAKGDVRQYSYNDEAVELDDLPADRVRELWLAALTAELRAATPDLGGGK
jgi:hypothetical protein